MPTSPTASSRLVVEQLRHSQIYRDYEKAFRETTGLPLNLRSADDLDIPHRGDPNENPFCAHLATSNQSCAACLQTQKKLEDAAAAGPASVTCFAGLSDSAVPVRVGENIVGYLRTGQVLLARPTPVALRRTAQALLEFGATFDSATLEQTYRQSRIVSRKQYDSILRLLGIFAQHLGTISNQLAMGEEKAESPAITRAKALIAEHHGDELSLGGMARMVNMSAFYFCKTFRKSTGLTFTDYVARVRIEKVKSLLLDPNKRISEAAYEAGFQSLSQFNRVFRRIAGEAPTAFRGRLHA